jgi:ubiquinol-cytochrome c reductase cytochrome b subunit
VGAWLNVFDYGQMLLFHVALLPFILGLIVVVHVLLVRRRGVVPPYSDQDTVPAPQEVAE